jgi:hypothetical protein
MKGDAVSGGAIRASEANGGKRHVIGDYLHAMLSGMQAIAGIVDVVLSYALISDFVLLLIAFLPSKKNPLAAGELGRPVCRPELCDRVLFLAGASRERLWRSLGHGRRRPHYEALGLFLAAILAKAFFSRSSVAAPD